MLCFAGFYGFTTAGFVLIAVVISLLVAFVVWGIFREINLFKLRTTLKIRNEVEKEFAEKEKKYRDDIERKEKIITFLEEQKDQAWILIKQLQQQVIAVSNDGGVKS
jgi:uncharacterized membrane protein YhiD involved in acid resistance